MRRCDLSSANVWHQAEVSNLKSLVKKYKRQVGKLQHKFRSEKTRLIEKLESKVALMKRMEAKWKSHLESFEDIMIKAEASRQNAGAWSWSCFSHGGWVDSHTTSQPRQRSCHISRKTTRCTRSVPLPWIACGSRRNDNSSRR